MAHPLDRPVWSALTGAQSALARGTPAAWRIDPSMGLFAAMRDPDARVAPSSLPSGDDPLWFVETFPVEADDSGLIATPSICVQMVAADPVEPATDSEIITLDDGDAAEMRDLAHRTRPGPFLARTHRFGGFVGVRHDGRLIAMAGTRLRPTGHVEVSGVCTDPDHRGRGLAARLMRVVMAQIAKEGAVPFLHAYASNIGAIRLYETLGFRTRREVVLTAISRAPVS